jgi:hypothetical protein
MIAQQQRSRRDDHAIGNAPRTEQKKRRCQHGDDRGAVD